MTAEHRILVALIIVVFPQDQFGLIDLFLGRSRFGGISGAKEFSHRRLTPDIELRGFHTQDLGTGDKLLFRQAKYLQPPRGMKTLPGLVDILPLQRGLRIAQRLTDVVRTGITITAPFRLGGTPLQLRLIGRQGRIQTSRPQGTKHVPSSLSPAYAQHFSLTDLVPLQPPVS